MAPMGPHGSHGPMGPMGPHGSPWAQWVPMGPRVPWVPWVPMGPQGPMGPMGPMGPHGAHGPWAKWPLTRAGVARKIHVARAPRSPKTEIYKKSCDPGLNHEPRVVFYAEFESGIGNGWKVDENEENYKF